MSGIASRSSSVKSTGSQKKKYQRRQQAQQPRQPSQQPRQQSQQPQQQAQQPQQQTQQPRQQSQQPLQPNQQPRQQSQQPQQQAQQPQQQTQQPLLQIQQPQQQNQQPRQQNLQPRQQNQKPRQQSQQPRHQKLPPQHQTQQSCQQLPVSMKDPDECVLCKKPCSLICERCESNYCSLECQRKDWPDHLYICLPMPRLVDKKPKSTNCKDPSTLSSKVMENDDSLEQTFDDQMLDDDTISVTSEIRPHSSPTSDFPKNNTLVILTGFRSPNRCYVRSMEPSQNNGFWEVSKLINEFGRIAQPLKSSPELGESVITMYNDRFYRGEVLNRHQGGIFRILLIDYGRIVLKSLSNLRQMTEQLFNLRRYVFPIALQNVDNFEFSNKLIAYVSSFENQAFRIEYFEQNRRRLKQCVLYSEDTNENFNEKLKAYFDLQGKLYRFNDFIKLKSNEKPEEGKTEKNRNTIPKTAEPERAGPHDKKTLKENKTPDVIKIESSDIPKMDEPERAGTHDTRTLKEIKTSDVIKIESNNIPKTQEPQTAGTDATKTLKEIKTSDVIKIESNDIPKTEEPETAGTDATKTLKEIKIPDLIDFESNDIPKTEEPEAAGTVETKTLKEIKILDFIKFESNDIPKTEEPKIAGTDETKTLKEIKIPDFIKFESTDIPQTEEPETAGTDETKTLKEMESPDLKKIESNDIPKTDEPEIAETDDTKTLKEIELPVLVPPFKTISFVEEAENVDVLSVDDSNIETGFFGCVAVSYLDNFKKINEYLSRYKDTEHPYKPKIDEYCLAKFKGDWYRAKVIDITDSSCFNVVYIDFTNEDIVDEKDIRRYPMDFDLPCCTNLCMIGGLPFTLDDNLIKYLKRRLGRYCEVGITKVIATEENVSIVNVEDLIEDLKSESLL